MSPFPFLSQKDEQFIRTAVRKEHAEVERLVYEGHVFTREEVVGRCLAELQSGIDYAGIDGLPNAFKAELTVISTAYAEEMADATMDFIHVLERIAAAERENQ